MRIRITKKTNDAGETTYYAYKRDHVFFFPYWVFLTLVVDHRGSNEDPIQRLIKLVEHRFKKEVIVMEYDL